MLTALAARAAADDASPTEREVDTDDVIDTGVCDVADADADADADAVTDDALAPEAALGEDVPTWAHGAGEDELREARRRRAPSPIGRLDVSVAWRRDTTDTRATQELWLLGTWRL